jgi:hypothetical protein
VLYARRFRRLGPFALWQFNLHSVRCRQSILQRALALRAEHTPSRALLDTFESPNSCAKSIERTPPKNLSSLPELDPPRELRNQSGQVSVTGLRSHTHFCAGAPGRRIPRPVSKSKY